MAKRRYNWQDWRHRYVTGDDFVTLEWLSKQPNAPSLHRLKVVCSRDDWTQQRKQFRYQLAGQVIKDDATEQAIAQIQKLIDASEAIARHIKLAKGLQRFIVERLNTMKPEDLPVSAIAQWLKISCDIERLALGLATQHSQIDVSQMSNEELEKIVAGEAL